MNTCNRLALSAVGLGLAFTSTLLATPVWGQTTSSTELKWSILTPGKFATWDYLKRLEALLLKFDRSRLQDEACFKSWISMNDKSAAALSSNEFEWPNVIAFYRKQTNATLDALPTQLVLDMSIRLERYDTATSTFPVYLKWHQATKDFRSATHREPAVIGGFHFNFQSGFTCQGKDSQLKLELDAPLNLASLAVPEARARQFVSRNANDRLAGVRIAVTLTDAKVKQFPDHYGSGPRIVFRGHVDAARVYEAWQLDPLAEVVTAADPQLFEKLLAKFPNVSPVLVDALHVSRFPALSK